MNPRAKIAEARFGAATITDLLDIRGFNLTSILEIEPDFLTDVTHEHDEDVTSFVFRADRPFDHIPLDEFITNMVENYGQKLMRYKGVIAVDGVPERIILQGVHMLMSSDRGAKWKRDEPRESKIVFIGRDMPRLELLRGLQSCLIPAQTAVV